MIRTHTHRQTGHTIDTCNQDDNVCVCVLYVQFVFAIEVAASIINLFIEGGGVVVIVVVSILQHITHTHTHLERSHCSSGGVLARR